MPFGFHFGQSSQVKTAETEHFFDDPKNWFDRLFGFAVNLPALLAGHALGHGQAALLVDRGSFFLLGRLKVVAGLVQYQRRSQSHITNGFNGNLFAKFGPEFFRNELLIGGTVYDENFALFTESVTSPRVTRSGLKFFPPSQVMITVVDLEKFDYPGKGTAEPDEDNNNLPDFTWTLGEDSDRIFRNQGFYVTNTAVLFNNRLRLMAGTRFDHMEQGQDSLRLVQTKQGDILSRDILQTSSQNIWTMQLAAMVNVRKNIGYYISKADSAVQQFLAIRERNFPPALAVPATPLLGE